MKNLTPFSFGRLWFLQLGLMILVPFLFKWIPNKVTAALVAGLLFNALSLGSVIKLIHKRSLSFYGSLFFLCCFAMPILALRLSDLDADFSSLRLFGISGQTLHQWSSPAYLLMMVLTVIDFIQERKKASLY